jgi:hypothetical protein
MRRLHRAYAAVGAGLSVILSLQASATGAQQPGGFTHPTVLLQGHPWDPVAIRLAAELRASSIRVLYVWDFPALDGNEDPVVLAHALGVAGLVEVDREIGDARITILDRGKPSAEMVVSAAGDPAVAAFRITEFARGALHLGGDPAATPAGAPAPASEVARLSAPVDVLPEEKSATRVSAGASVGAALASSTAGFGPSVQILAGVFWMPIPVAGLELIVLAPTTAAHWSGAAGDASLTFGLATAGVRIDAWSSPWVAVDASLGLGAVVARSEGQAALGYSAYERTTWTGAGLVRVGAAFKIFPTVRIRIDAFASLVAPSVTYSAPQSPPIGWGSPLLMSALSVEAGLRAW